MTTKSIPEWAGLALLALGTLRFPVSTAQAQGTAFTYQGQLISGGNPANGFFDFEFSLFPNAAGSGSQVGSTITQAAIGVTNGLFATALDFGPVFAGNATWLAISVRSNDVGSFTALTPLQALYPTPYAQFANTASNLSGTVPLAQLAGGVVTNNEAAVTLGGLTVSNLYLPATGTNTGVIYAGGSPLIQSYGGQNFFAGQNAGDFTVGGHDNVGVGYGAMQLFSGGGGDTAVGALALSTSTGGNNNTAVGFQALNVNASGYANTAIGASALLYNQFGGSENTAIGSEALIYLSSTAGSGSGNIALGYQAGFNLSANNNNNIDIGNQGAASDNGIIRIGTLGTHTNTFIAGVINGNGGGLTNVSASSLAGGTIPVAQLPAVVGLLSDPGSGNFFAGQNSGNAAVKGAFNAGFGQAALQSLTIGSYNTAVGTAALAANTVGSVNTAIGDSALQFATNGTANIALGYNAGNNLATGNNNIYIGNAGASAESGIIRIGTPGTQTTTYIAGNLGLGGAAPQQTLSLNGGMNIDESGLNRGTVNNALTFGSNSGATSGEGIGSIRTNGYAGSFGLSFYTDYANRMTILQNGNVGIGTDNPDGLLTVKGTFTATTVGLGGAVPQQTLSLNGGMNIDQSSLNRGTVNNALTFGTSYGSTSGEGIGSIRTNGYADSFGLDFYTDYVNRMTILNNGNVGIGTNAPSQALEVHGNYVLIDGGFGSQWQRTH